MNGDITLAITILTFKDSDDRPHETAAFTMTGDPERVRRRAEAFLTICPMGLYIGKDNMVYPRAVVTQWPADMEPGVDIPTYILSPEGIAAIRQNVAYRSDADGHTMGILAYALARIRTAFESDCDPEERSDRIQKALDGVDSEP